MPAIYMLNPKPRSQGSGGTSAWTAMAAQRGHQAAETMAEDLSRGFGFKG